MDTTDDVVYSWKEYTASGDRASSPVASIDVDEIAIGGLAAPGSWSFSCCTTTLCSDCSIQ